MPDRFPARSTDWTYSVVMPAAYGASGTVTGAPRLGASTRVVGGDWNPYRYPATSSTPLSETPLESKVKVPVRPNPPWVLSSARYSPSAEVTAGGLSGASASTVNSHQPVVGLESVPSLSWLRTA